ncbi:MAG: MerR family DNA-binding transcriptional regulator [Actinomycetota bacterium]|nr:MerR family DNA-binding transcriptional regulator [Actinomycetota bacterium]MDQ3575598.1 MerR family DNA-binding transcriptional regulator [Actinomycetota bacterium]
MAERAYLSIGEVLSLLQAEFPDVTISKIRFLESQGLLDPERTPSGYRKFYQTDVERLRWILRQQRENFLPLKVIKGRLLGPPEDTSDGGEGADSGPEESPATEAVPVATDSSAERTPVQPTETQPKEPQRPPAPPAGSQPEKAAEPRARVVVQREPLPRLGLSDLSPGLSGSSLTLEELATASGQSPERIRDLERAGFIVGRLVADVVYYDEECLVVAELMGGFARFGIEPRHLRIYKNSAERESGLFQQVIVPLLKQRNPEARQRAVDTLEELSHLGERLRTIMLRQAIKGLIGG